MKDFLKSLPGSIGQAIEMTIVIMIFIITFSMIYHFTNSFWNGIIAIFFANLGHYQIQYLSKK